jgi:putative transcriptional regulator
MAESVIGRSPEIRRPAQPIGRSKESMRPMNATMMRVRLKADGRIVEILPDGSERAIPSAAAAKKMPAVDPMPDAAYAKGIRARTKLTQAEFAARIGVPIETVRNWEQGKRSPRGPARALLKMLDRAPDLAFAVLTTAKPAP